MEKVSLEVMATITTLNRPVSLFFFVLIDFRLYYYELKRQFEMYKYKIPG